MKLCPECSEVKSRSEFYAHPRTSDGLLGICKACHKARMKKNRVESERARTYDRMRAKTAERRARARAITIRWRRENPEAYRAETAVSNAIRDGRLKRGEVCEVADCGRTDLHAHHDDYSKPLEVRWLCPLHHHRGHAEETAHG